MEVMVKCVEDDREGIEQPVWLWGDVTSVGGSYTHIRITSVRRDGGGQYKVGRIAIFPTYYCEEVL